MERRQGLEGEWKDGNEKMRMKEGQGRKREVKDG